jgi:IS5 family transposase
MQKAIKRQRTIVSILQPEVGRKLSELSQADPGHTLYKAKRLVPHTDSRKAVSNWTNLRSWNLQEVHCTSKGQIRDPYEFGVKVGLIIALMDLLYAC